MMTRPGDQPRPARAARERSAAAVSRERPARRRPRPRPGTASPRRPRSCAASSSELPRPLKRDPGVMPGLTTIVAMWPPPLRVGAALVPGDEQDRIREGRAVDDLRHEGLEERVAGRDGAAVHVVDQVGDDHLEVGRRRVEARQVRDVGAAALVPADLDVADGRVVLAGVLAGEPDPSTPPAADRAGVAVARVVLGVDVPGAAGSLDLVEEVRGAPGCSAVAGRCPAGRPMSGRCSWAPTGASRRRSWSPGRSGRSASSRTARPSSRRCCRTPCSP